MKNFTSKTQKTGEKGENEAVLYLKGHGYDVVERNVANKFGEIDIVAKKNNQYYFFEVKTGNLGSGINPAENLNPQKLKKVMLSVQYYCFTHKVTHYNVLGLVVLFDGPRVKIEILDLT